MAATWALRSFRDDTAIPAAHFPGGFGRLIGL
jgi:hypothetical protein